MEGFLIMAPLLALFITDICIDNRSNCLPLFRSHESDRGSGIKMSKVLLLPLYYKQNS
jgi:hypothetical protein